MRHIGKLIFIILIIGVFYVFSEIITVSFDNTKNRLDNIKDTQNIVDLNTANAIIRQVETAYSSAYMKNMGYPTLEQVKSSFAVENVVWNENNKIEAQNFTCNVEFINNNLKVTCLDISTKNNLIIVS